MRTLIIALACACMLLVASANTALHAGEAVLQERDPIPPKAVKAPAKWEGDLAKKLTRRVSFEFVDTPVQDALTFMQTLASANFIIDPKAAEKGLTNKPISLRVQDMDMKTALDWICRMADLSCEQQNQAVFITVGEERVETGEGLAVYRLPQGLPKGLTGEKLKALTTVAAPKARVAYDADLKLLIVASEDPKELRRAEALLRVLGIDPKTQQEKGLFEVPPDAVPPPARPTAPRPAAKKKVKGF